VQRGTNDFFPVLTKLIAKNPDVIAPISMVDGMAALTIQQSKQLGYEGAFAFHTFHNYRALIEKAGEDAMDKIIMINVDNLNPSAPPVFRELHDRYIEKYKEKFSSVANAVYPVLFILKQGFEKAGSLDTSDVAAALETLKGVHPYGGKFSMGGLQTYGANHQIIAPVIMSEIRKGKEVYLGTVFPPVP